MLVEKNLKSYSFIALQGLPIYLSLLTILYFIDYIQFQFSYFFCTDFVTLLVASLKS